MATYRSSQRVRGVPPPRTPHCQTDAAEQRLCPGYETREGNWELDNPPQKTRVGGEGRGWKEEGLLEKEKKEEKRRRDLAKGVKTAGRIKPRRNSFASWGHRCTGFSPLFCGTWHTHSDGPSEYTTQDLIGSALFPRECNESEQCRCLHHIIPFISIYQTNWKRLRFSEALASTTRP